MIKIIIAFVAIGTLSSSGKFSVKKYIYENIPDEQVKTDPPLMEVVTQLPLCVSCFE